METYDIIVCGAGSAGFCAAVAAARMGAKTALVEKYNTPGGILTVLGNNSIDQFNNPFIADKKMVITGIGWELVLRLHKEGYARIPDMNAPRENHEQYGVKVNPVAAAKIMDDMLLESGVSLYYGQSVVDAETVDGRIESILIATKSGLKRLGAKIFIDCTGDGDLAAFAGRVKNAVFVSDYIYADAERYDETTEAYRRCLAEADRRLAKVCDTVIEVSAGQLTIHKGDLCI